MVILLECISNLFDSKVKECSNPTPNPSLVSTNLFVGRKPAHFVQQLSKQLPSQFGRISALLCFCKFRHTASGLECICRTCGASIVLKFNNIMSH